MNVVLFAWCPSGAVYLDALLAAGEPPRLVVTGPRAAADSPLALECARRGIAMERCADVNAPDFIERLRGLPVELLLVAGCAQILGAELLGVPRIGALNFHPSLLPDYRGKEPLFWAILRGEPRVGITVHHLTEEVDAGPILLQREVAVPERATSASLAALVDRAGAALVPEIVASARAGALPPGITPDRPGSRVPPLRPEHGLLDFTRSAIEIDRLVRAARGEIAAYCHFNGMRLVILEGEPAAPLHPSQSSIPGRVAWIDGESIGVGTGDGVYAIRSVLFLHRARPASAWATELGIEVGAALTANPAFR